MWATAVVLEMAFCHDCDAKSQALISQQNATLQVTWWVNGQSHDRTTTILNSQRWWFHRHCSTGNGVEEVTKLGSGEQWRGQLMFVPVSEVKCHVCGITGCSLRQKNEGLAVGSLRGGQGLHHEWPSKGPGNYSEAGAGKWIKARNILFFSV